MSIFSGSFRDQPLGDSFRSFNFGSGGGNRYQPTSLVKCGVIVGDIPPIPNRVRALARVIQNCDPLQFPDLHDRETGELQERAVVQILAELDVTLTEEERRVFPLALRECKRSLWRSAVYKDTKERAMDPQPVSKILALCNSIDTEAAFAGAALGEIPAAVLLSFKTFSEISAAIAQQTYASSDHFQDFAVEPVLSSHPVLLQLYECAVEPLTTMHRIIRDHNMYSTRRQAAFSRVETDEIATANETLNYLVQHLLLVIEALRQSRRLRPKIDSGASARGTNVTWETDIERYFVRTAEEEEEEQETANNRIFSMASMFDDVLLCAAWAETIGDAVPAVLMRDAGPFLAYFPEWSRDMMAQFLDYFSHGVLSVFGLQRVALLWGPSTIMPYKIANDVRHRAAFLIGKSPLAVRQHIRECNPEMERRRRSVSSGTTELQMLQTGGNKSGGETESKAIPTTLELSPRGAYAITLTSSPAQVRAGEPTTVAVYVRTMVKPPDATASSGTNSPARRRSSVFPPASKLQPQILINSARPMVISPTPSVVANDVVVVRHFEMVRKEGMWEICGVSSLSGLGGHETISDAIAAFDRFFVHPCGTIFPLEFHQRVALVFKEAALAAHAVGTIINSSSQQQQQQQAKPVNKREGGSGIIGGGGPDDKNKRKKTAEEEKRELEERIEEEAARNTDSTSLLHRAAYACDIPLVRKLLRFGSEAVVNFPQCDPIVSNGVDWPPLIFAACTPMRRAVSCIELLTQHGADVGFVDAHGNTALYYAIVNGHAAACAHLLQRDPSLMATVNTVSPLFVALGAHWLHPELNDIHAFSSVRVSAAVIEAILYNAQLPCREDMLLVLDILRAKERGLDKFHAQANVQKKRPVNKNINISNADDSDGDASDVVVRKNGDGIIVRDSGENEEEDETEADAGEDDDEEELYSKFLVRHASSLVSGLKSQGSDKYEQQATKIVSAEPSAALSSSVHRTNSTYARPKAPQNSGVTAAQQQQQQVTGDSINSADSGEKSVRDIRRELRAARAARFAETIKQASFSVSSVEEHAAAIRAFRERHGDFWRRHLTLITPGQRRRVIHSIAAHGAFLRNEMMDGAAELYRARRVVQDFLFFLSCQQLRNIEPAEPFLTVEPVMSNASRRPSGSGLFFAGASSASPFFAPHQATSNSMDSRNASHLRRPSGSGVGSRRSSLAQMQFLAAAGGGSGSGSGSGSGEASSGGGGASSWLQLPGGALSVSSALYSSSANVADYRSSSPHQMVQSDMSIHRSSSRNEQRKGKPF